MKNVVEKKGKRERERKREEEEEGTQKKKVETSRIEGTDRKQEQEARQDEWCEQHQEGHTTTVMQT